MSDTNTQEYRSFARLMLMTMNACLSLFYLSYNIVYLGTFDFQVIYTIFEIEIDPALAQGILQGLIPIGCGIGSLLSLPLILNFSRRNSLLITNVLSLIIGLALLVPHPYLLFVCRFLQGVCGGLYGVISSLIIKQFAPISIAGILGSMSQVFISGGACFAFILQYLLMQKTEQEDHWRTVFGFSPLTTTLQTFFLLTVFHQETPKYLLEIGHEEECRRVLKWIYHEEYVEQVLNEKKLDLNQKRKGEMLSGQSRKRRWTTGLHLTVLQQFIGINAIVGYGTKICAQILPSYRSFIPIFLNLEQFIAAFFTTYLLSKIGRKTILQTGTIVIALALLLISFGFFNQSLEQSTRNICIIVGLAIFMIGFAISLGTMVWLYIPKQQSPMIAVAIVMVAFPISMDYFESPNPMFFIFGQWGLASIFINKKLVVETKGKTEAEIFAQFDDQIRE